jgi:hypothetical protein
MDVRSIVEHVSEVAEGEHGQGEASLARLLR